MSGLGQPGSGPSSQQSLRHDGKPAVRATRNIFVATGLFLLLLLSIVPIWSAISLMLDDNYLFWSGTGVPMFIFISCICVIVLYGFTSLVFFQVAAPEARNDQTVVLIACVFVSLLGLVLMIGSLPLSRQAADTYHNLMHNCRTSLQTRGVYQHYVALQTLRSQPDCVNKFSVEECAGFVESAPYTAFLKATEANSRCSGFCFQPFADHSVEITVAPPLPAPPVKSDINVVAPLATAAAAVVSHVSQVYPIASGKLEQSHTDHVIPLALLQESGSDAGPQEEPQARWQLTQEVQMETQTQAGSLAEAEADEAEPPLPPKYPQTLFSNTNYQASCQGMVARDVKNFVGDVAYYMFYEGVFLVLISVGCGFLNLVNQCARQKGLRRYYEGASGVAFRTRA